MFKARLQNKKKKIKKKNVEIYVTKFDVNIILIKRIDL